jgi:radical SAM protein with 4Fe4S-binding SPASM domain
MEAIFLHHLGVPCVAKHRDSSTMIISEDKIYHLNPRAILRDEPEGVVITPPLLYSSFVFGDMELANLLRQHCFSAKGLPVEMISLLEENEVIAAGENKFSQEFYRKLKVGVSGLPTQVLLDVTSRCNCDCLTCYHKGDLDGYEPSLADLLKRIDALKRLGVGLFEVTGGESLLRPDLADLLLYLDQAGLHYYVVSNGEYLSQASKQLIDVLRGGLGLAISLDGVGKIHDSIRQRPGLYGKLMKGLDFVAARGVKLYFISTIFSGNISCVPEMVEVAAKYGATLHLRPAIMTGSAAENKLNVPSLASCLREYLGHPSVRNGLLETKKTIPRAKYYGCGIRKRISVSSRGELFPCVMDRKRGLRLIVEYSGAELIAELESETRFLLNGRTECRSCRYNQDFLQCGGFCRFSKSYKKG